MLRKNFLRDLSSFVSKAISKDEEYFADEFSYFVEGKEPPEDRMLEEKIVGLFSEWVVFDRKQKMFNGKTGLEYFLQENSEKLSEDDFRAYGNLLMFEVGLFDVTKVHFGEGVMLVSLKTNKEQYVYDVNASMNLKEGEIIWTRISAIGGLYHMVGSLMVPLSFDIKEGLRDEIRTWKVNSCDAKYFSNILFHNGDASSVGLTQENFQKNMSKSVSGKSGKGTYSETKVYFEKILKECKMDAMISVTTFEKWAKGGKLYPFGFATKALFFMLPGDLSSSQREAMINAAMHFGNAIPKSKTSLIQAASSQSFVVPFEMDLYSHDKYVAYLERVSAYMAKQDFLHARKECEDLISLLLIERVPYFDVFRLYANVGGMLLHENDDKDRHLGEQLCRAALRLNPKYSFAQETLDRYGVIDESYLATVSPKNRKLAQAVYTLIKDSAKRQYRRTIFAKYEDFLAKIGVSLSYETNVVVTKYEDGKSHTLGRNDPCYCGSLKKFKKCHGA